MEWSTIVMALVFIGVATSALFIFVSAARLFVSDTDEVERKSQGAQPERRSVISEANRRDRRQRSGRVEFPLQLGGMIIENERRQMPDRRQNTVH